MFQPHVIISAKTAIEIIQAIVIAKDDENFPFRDDELKAYAELWNALSSEQKAEVDNTLHECYRGEADDKNPGAMSQLKCYALTGIDNRTREI